MEAFWLMQLCLHKHFICGSSGSNTPLLIWSLGHHEQIEKGALKREYGDAPSRGERVTCCTGMPGYSREEAEKRVDAEGQRAPSYLRSTDYEKNSADHRCNFGLR